MTASRGSIRSVPSTGKSSNSSSSSKTAGACFCWSFIVGPEGASDVVALVVVKAPSPAADMATGLLKEGFEIS